MSKSFFTRFSISSKTAYSALLLGIFAVTATPALAATIDFTNPGGFVGSIAVAAVGIGGGVALLLLIYGGLMFSLSHGDPTKVEEAQQIITNALGGLALIVFATLILRIVGKDVLNLPGFPNISI